MMYSFVVLRCNPHKNTIADNYRKVKVITAIFLEAAEATAVNTIIFGSSFENRIMKKQTETNIDKPLNTSSRHTTCNNKTHQHTTLTNKSHTNILC